LIYIEGIRFVQKKERPRNAKFLGPRRLRKTRVERRGYTGVLTSNAEPLGAASAARDAHAAPRGTGGDPALGSGWGASGVSGSGRRGDLTRPDHTAFVWARTTSLRLRNAVSLRLT